jgi:hypothetical protein
MLSTRSDPSSTVRIFGDLTAGRPNELAIMRLPSLAFHNRPFWHNSRENGSDLAEPTTIEKVTRSADHQRTKREKVPFSRSATFNARLKDQLVLLASRTNKVSSALKRVASS